MDASALTVSIRSLESSLDRSGVWLTVCTALVVLGLVVEYLPAIADAVRSRPIRIGSFRGVVGGILVTVGVAGELFVGFRAGAIETRLRAANEQAFAAFNKEAGEARRAAGEAIERAGNAEKAAKGFEAQIADANARAQEAEAQAARARAESKNAVATASAASTRTTQTEARITPRRLSVEQRAALVSALREAPTKGQVIISCVMGDGEGAAFANQLDTALKDAGWPTSAAQELYVGGNPIGFGIVVKSARTAPQHAGALQRAFAAAGLKVVAAADDKLAIDAVVLLIGNKPQ